MYVTEKAQMSVFTSLVENTRYVWDCLSKLKKILLLMYMRTGCWSYQYVRGDAGDGIQDDQCCARETLKSWVSWGV